MTLFSTRSDARSEANTDADAALVNQKAEYFFNLFGNSVLRLAYSYLHNTEDSEEVLQETLIKYISSAPAFESDEHAKAWLLRVAANISKNRIDYNRRRQTDELAEELAAEEKTDLSFVWEAVKSLKPVQREAIHLFYQEGYSTKEIADILGRNESSVRSDLKRGREALKTILKEAYDFE
ncbi:MAG: sigma-70 family RNA polymerase sigma factor [Clostridia bacterium]|nr:sigma-70 family RNA polymerase sigma factor [Clostridia bacterium]